MEAFLESASLLGMPRPKSQLQFVDMVEKGLPLKALNRLCDHFAPADAAFKYLFVPKATYARYAEHDDLLSAAHSAKIARLAQIWSVAHRIWRTNDRTRDFFLRTHPLLASRRPIDVAMENELGGQLVRDILGRLENGSAV